MAVTREQVAEIYVATFNRAPLDAGLDYWTESGFTIEQIATSFFNQDEAQAIYTDGGEPIPSEEFVTIIFDNLFGRAPAEAGLEYWSTALDEGTVSQAEMILAVANGATGDDAAILANKTEVGLYYADQGGEEPNYSLADIDETDASVDAAKDEIDHLLDPVVEESFTAGTDDITGGAGNDTFEAPIVQNPWAGGVSNSLSTADELDGLGGTDSLYAELVPEYYGVTGDNTMDVQPEIHNVEDIRFESMDVWSANLDDEDNDDADAVITVDAKRITDVDHIGSAYSDGDLVIENLTTLTSDGVALNTDTITITMDHTDNFNHDGDASDLTVLFDEDYLLSGQSVQSAAIYYLLDQDADMNNTDVDGDGTVDLLAYINTNGLRFTVNGGEELVLEFDQDLLTTADMTQRVLNHDDFVAALQGSLQALIASGDVPADTTLTVDYTTTRTTFLDDGSVSSLIPAIVLASQSTSGIESVGFLWVEDLSGNFNVYGRLDDEEGVDENPVAINVELDKVGRDNDGGDLMIGGKHDEAIPDFYVEVLGDEDRPSNLGTITTNDQTTYDEALGGEYGLENVYISTHADYVDGETYASLTIRNGFENQLSVDLVDADDFFGDLILGTGTAVNDLIVLEARGGGDVTFIGLVDGTTGGIDNVLANDDRAYSYTTGSGNDTFVVTLDGDAVDAAGVGPESFAIITGGGDDTVDIISVDGVSQRTMFILDNLSIETGDGADRVTINGYERFDIQTGAGDDYVEITSVDPLDGATGRWAFGAPTGVQPFVDRVLYKAELTVTFAGFESTVTVDTDAAGNFVADQVIINAAIIEAIEQSTVLDELLDYDLGASDQFLVITSDFDGANELAIDLYQPTLKDADAVDGEVVFSSGDLTAIRQGIINTTVLTSADLENEAEVIAEFNDGTTANLGDGSLSQTGNDISTDQFDYQFLAANADATADATIEQNYSVINTSTGNDIVVLHSNDVSANTLVFDSEFNYLTVVNFFDDAARTVTGNHIFDFTYYLDNQQDPSDAPAGNAQSVVDIGITYDGPETAAAGDDLVGNEFTVVKATFDDDDTFDGLTASNFLAAINDDDGTADYADIDNDTLDAADFGDNFVGTVQDHIVFVENNENRGEYKVFHLTSELDADGNVDNADGDFETSTLLGTIDFGAEITGDPISMANLLGSDDPTGDGTTTWDDYYLNDLLAGEGGVEDTTPPTLDSFTPADDATDVPVDADLVLNFSETVQAGTGNILVFDADGLVEAVSVEDAIFDGNTVTVDLLADLAPGTDYYVRVQPTAIEDEAGNAFAGIAAPTDFNFTTVAVAGNEVDMTAGGSYTATDGVVDVFQYEVDSSSGRAVGKDGEVSITGFNLAEDSLQFVDAGDNLTDANFTTFAGVSLAENPFADNTTVAFDPDAGVSNVITIAGIQDAALATIDFTIV
ncbi:Ig-like domain-containing protein [Desulfobacter sp.]|uniref:Ig-like domain-containing protein n=1 Tax=Desulfobacter sp. TaxID=2294 RepID=UPI000E8A1B50|nr:Ig-like domain-containing protein [Desulfobacter sp.]HBT87670.1 hypothetical protein [Desulfobacter sp.]